MSTSWVNGLSIAGGAALALVFLSGRTSGQALAPVAEPLREAARQADGSSTLNLFEQERSTARATRDQQESGRQPVTQLRGTAQPSRPVSQEATRGYIDALQQAGVVVDSRNSNQMVVERILPDSAAFRAGLVRGDVIIGITFGVQIIRNGQSGQLNLSEPTLRTVTQPAPDVPNRIITSGQTIAPENSGARVIAPSSGSVTGPGVAGSASMPQGPGTPGLGTAPAEGGGSAATRTGKAPPLLPGQETSTTPR